MSIVFGHRDVGGDRILVSPRVAIVIPSKDEAESLGELLNEISTALAGDDFEVIVVDDGSSDASPRQIAEAADANRGYPAWPVGCWQDHGRTAAANRLPGG